MRKRHASQYANFGSLRKENTFYLIIQMTTPEHYKYYLHSGIVILVYATYFLE